MTKVCISDECIGVDARMNAIEYVKIENNANAI